MGYGLILLRYFGRFHVYPAANNASHVLYLAKLCPQI